MPKSDLGSYTKFPNALLEYLIQSSLPNYEIRLLLFIARRTFGFHRNGKWVSTGKMSEQTSIKRRHIQRTIRALEKKNLITVSRENPGEPHYSINVNGDPCRGAGGAPVEVQEVTPVEVPIKEIIKKRFKESENPSSRFVENLTKTLSDGMSLRKPVFDIQERRRFLERQREELLKGN